MRLLFITQAIDEGDPVLGFVVGWLFALSKKFERVNVICLRKGRIVLPQNVSVFSLGKEVSASRLKYLVRFFSYIWRLRKDYDGVFVHMNPEYVILGGFFWKFWGKKIVFWYNHTSGNFLSRLVFLLSSAVCHTSPFASSAGRKNSFRMPAGIDTESFCSRGGGKKPQSVLFLGRISPIKDLGTLLVACNLLQRKHFDFVLDIVGESIARDYRYEEEMRSCSKTLQKEEKVFWLGPIPNRKTPEVFSAHEVNVNLTPSGNYDKTVLEAMACGTITLVSSPAFEGVVPARFVFREKDQADLALKIEEVLSLPADERQSIGNDLRRVVIEKESLALLVTRLSDLFNTLRS